MPVNARREGVGALEATTLRPLHREVASCYPAKQAWCGLAIARRVVPGRSSPGRGILYGRGRLRLLYRPGRRSEGPDIRDRAARVLARRWAAVGRAARADTPA